MVNKLLISHQQRHRVKSQDKSRQGETRQDWVCSAGVGYAVRGKKKHKIRQGKTSQDKARQGKTSQDKARQGKIRQDKARQVQTRQDKARQVKTRQDKARQVKTRQDKSRQSKIGYAVRGRVCSAG